MDLSRPARSIAAAQHIDVLTVLAGTTLSLTGREVQRLTAGASQSGVRVVLRQLVSSGLVHLTEAGGSHLYAFNREHVAADAVLAFSDLRGKLFDRIRTAMLSWSTPPLSAAVFGSAARGDGDESSDIDLFVVRPAAVPADDPGWMGDVAELNAAVLRWSGNTGSVIEATPQQVLDMAARGERIIDELRRDQIALLGSSVLDVAVQRA